jgi:hypothetical protein
MRLRLPLLSGALKLSKSKPGCKVSALHLFVKWIPLMAFWHRAHSETCFFQLLIPGLTPISHQENELWFEFVTHLAHTGKQPFSHLSSVGDDDRDERRRTAHEIWYYVYYYIQHWGRTSIYVWSSRAWFDFSRAHQIQGSMIYSRLPQLTVRPHDLRTGRQRGLQPPNRLQPFPRRDIKS